MFHNRGLNYLLVILISLGLCLAAPSPTDPYGETVWHTGEKVKILWDEAGQPKTSKMSGIHIQLMTGPDLNQIPLAVVAPKLPTTAKEFEWTVPSLKQYGYPSGKIYFFMFSDPKTPANGLAWTTRFTIIEGTETPVQYDPKTTFTFTKSPTAPTPEPAATTAPVTTTPASPAYPSQETPATVAAVTETPQVVPV
ncbi:354_t:CDS:2 [Entrophospora sp. SA101]|nr:354_t:CDS:2 [Entrophospora sp. SA101]